MIEEDFLWVFQLYAYFKESVYFSQILQVVERLDTSQGHPLALLAEELKKFLKKDSVTFMPVLSQRHPQATIVSATLVHKLYGNRLASVYIIFVYVYFAGDILEDMDIMELLIVFSETFYGCC